MRKQVIGLGLSVLLGAALIVGIITDPGVSTAASTSRKLGPGQVNPTATPVPDSHLMGVPRPTVKPSCGTGIVGVHGSTQDDCIYSCNGANRRVVSGTGCTVPTNTVTATPTVTATVTP